MQDYDQVFARLRRESARIAGSGAAERVDKIRRLYRAVYELRGEIGRAGDAELGMDGRLSLLPLKAEADHACERLAGWMQRREVEQVPSLLGRRAYVHYEPKGVVLHLATWNSPVLISLSPLISMIAAGNAVVLKPSEVAPQSAELVRQVIERAGLGDEVAVITGGPEVAEALLKLPFDHICYVGNNRIGRLIMEAAARNFAGVTLEMGGKNPAVIDASADIEDAAAKLAFARHIINGQVCLSPDYVLVHESLKARFLEALQNKIRAFYDSSGKGFAASPDVARIINERHVRRIKALIDEAVAKGARLVMGGDADPDTRFVAPTVLVGVTPAMAIYHEEVFGPVLFVEGFTNREEAVAEIARRPKPLAIYIFTRERESADWFLAHTRAGTSAINNAVVQANIQSLPFGGANHSGIGRLGGQAGFVEFSNPRAVVEDALDTQQGAPMFYPPFPKEALDYVDHMLAP
ncbi:MAG: aldehyde dehydrogenase family protein [Proteobacteria bacterium]|nr:aldehyde dehydrogenase family protein [Pseudomonadota bacterium]